MSLNFNGVFIYTSFIIDLDVALTVDQTSTLKFFLDGRSEAESMEYISLSSTLTNSLYKSTRRLPGGDHCMLIKIDAAHIGTFAFDYAVYTRDDADTEEPTSSSGSATVTRLITSHTARASSTGSSRRNDLGAAVGATLGGMAIVFALLSWFCIRCRRRGERLCARASRDPDGAGSSPTPFYAHPDPAAASVEAKNTDFLDAKDPVTPLMQPAPLSLLPATHTKRLGFATKSVFLRVPALLAPTELATTTGWPSPLPAPNLLPEGASSTMNTAYLRTELDRARAEIDMLRQVAEPPPYSDARAQGVNICRTRCD